MKVIEFYADKKWFGREAIGLHINSENALKAKLDEAVNHLKKVCEPEADGFGGFVSDEFTDVHTLKARQFLKELKGEK